MRLTLFFLVCVIAVHAQSTHYSVKLIPDLNSHILSGKEVIKFTHGMGNVVWQKQPGLTITSSRLDDGKVMVREDAVATKLSHGGAHVLKLQYTATPHRGIAWFSNQPGFDTAFYCESWMVCSADPGQRATLTLQVVVPRGSGLTAVGPGQFQKQWSDKEGRHFVFEQSVPVQTYLFSFGVANLHRVVSGNFILYSPDTDAHKAAFQKTSAAYAFLRAKAGIDLPASQYTQAFMPNGIEQEAAALALMPKDFPGELEEKGEVGLMTHELAHQWWGVTVGIKSWSDFWLNEGMADFLEDAYLEATKGKSAYDERIQQAREQFQKLRAEGKDRPLHWEGWKDAQGALGPLPYVKGALFLDRLRAELGEEAFWGGIALYTQKNAGRLVDSQDFERAMEEVSGRDLKKLFDEAVYH